MPQRSGVVVVPLLLVEERIEIRVRIEIDADEKIAVGGSGSRISPIRPKNAEVPPRRTASSNVMGMLAGGLCAGRFATLMGKSTTFMK